MGAPSVANQTQFGNTITLIAQQMRTRLRDRVMVDSNWKGNKKFYSQYGKNTMTELLSRYQNTPISSVDHRRRMVTPRYWVVNDILDPVDALQMVGDPLSAYMQANVAAANRQTDQTIIDALNGAAYSGETGTDSNTIAAAQKITAGGTGLTLVKITSAAKVLNKAEVPMEDRTLVINSEALDDCLNTTGITSVDYNSVKALMNGDINTFMGFTWVRSELLPTDSSSSRLLYAFQKTGIQLAIQKEPTARLTERPDLNYGWQAYLSMCMGAVRLEEEKVVEIAITE
jgi:hypothetical protein